MNYHQEYLGLIFTNHALERMQGRGLTQDWAWQTFKHSDQSYRGKNESTRFIKRFDKYKVTIVAKQNERGEWVVISAWIDPPPPGSIDVGKKEKYREYQKASFLRKLWLTFRQQIGF